MTNATTFMPYIYCLCDVCLAYNISRIQIVQTYILVTTNLKHRTLLPIYSNSLFFFVFFERKKNGHSICTQWWFSGVGIGGKGKENITKRWIIQFIRRQNHLPGFCYSPNKNNCLYVNVIAVRLRSVVVGHLYKYHFSSMCSLELAVILSSRKR